DLRNSFARGRAELVDAGNRVADFFDWLGDLRFHFFHARTAERGGNRHDRKIDVGEEVDSQPEVGSQSQDNRRRNQHHREDGPANANFPNAHRRTSEGVAVEEDCSGSADLLSVSAGLLLAGKADSVMGRSRGSSSAELGEFEAACRLACGAAGSMPLAPDARTRTAVPSASLVCPLVTIWLTGGKSPLTSTQVSPRCPGSTSTAKDLFSRTTKTLLTPAKETSDSCGTVTALSSWRAIIAAFAKFPGLSKWAEFSTSTSTLKVRLPRSTEGLTRDTFPAKSLSR